MALPALAPLLTILGRAALTTGARSLGSASLRSFAPKGLAASGRNLGQAGVDILHASRQARAANGGPGGGAQAVSQIIGQSSSFGNIMSGSKSANAEVAEHDTAAKQQAAADGEAQREAAAAKLGAALGVVTLGATGLAAAFAKLPTAMEGFSRSILAGQEKLRQFNGQIGNAFAKLEFGDLRRSRDTANKTSGSTAALAEALDSLADSTQEIRQAGITLLNLVGTGLATVGEVLAFLVKIDPFFGTAIKWLASIEENTRKNEPKPFDEFLTAVADGTFSRMKRDRVTPTGAGPGFIGGRKTGGKQSTPIGAGGFPVGKPKF